MEKQCRSSSMDEGEGIEYRHAAVVLQRHFRSDFNSNIDVTGIKVLGYGCVCVSQYTTCSNRFCLN